MVKQFIKNNIFFIAAIAGVAAAFVALNCLFPYSGDDWYWATRSFSWTSITELNGRYLGSILSLIITRFKWLRVILCAGITVALIYLLSLNGTRHRTFYFAAAAALFIAMPVSMLSEVITWASGFANYMPSALVVIAYVVLVRGEFASEAPAYGRATQILAFALGVVGALFMETVTIGNVIVGAAVVIYHFIRFKKPSGALIAFLVGAIAGAALMFSDSVYFKIAEGEDEIYGRSVSLSLSAIKDSYFQVFYGSFAFDNFWLNLVLVGAFAWLFARTLPALKTFERAIIIACFAVQGLFLLESGSVFLGGGIVPGQPYFNYEGAVKGILTLFFFAALIVETAILFKDKNAKLRGLFLLGAILAYSLPLLVVSKSNVGPRNFVCAYALFIVLALTVLDENMKGVRLSEGRLLKCLGCVCSAAVVIVGAFYIVRYAQIYSAYAARENAIAARAEGDELTLERLPVTDEIGGRTLSYVHNADPDNSYFTEYFKYYYNIDQSVKISVGDFTEK